MSKVKCPKQLNKVPLCYENTQNFCLMYGKSMLHFIFISCMLGTNLTLEVNCMTKLTIKSNSLEVVI